MRQQGDAPADAFVAAQMSLPNGPARLYALIDPEKPALSPAEFAAAFPMGAELAATLRLPVWANQDCLQAGARLFTRYAETIMSLLGLLSLPYCYAAADGAFVLYQSERMRRDTTTRLYHTALFVWRMMAPDAFLPGSTAFGEILKVRLTHAVARYHLNQRDWEARLGLPINQEDMAGTNLAFSLIVLRGLRQFGLPVAEAEAQGFLHSWRVIGYLSGIDERLLTEDSMVADWLDASISRRHFRHSAHGVQLTAALMDHIFRVNRKKISAKDIAALLRRMLGNSIADLLEIPPDELAAGKWLIIRLLQRIKGIWLSGTITARYTRAYARFLQAGILAANDLR